MMKTCPLYQMDLLQFMERMLLIVMKLKLKDPKLRKPWIKLTSLMPISKKKDQFVSLGDIARSVKTDGKKSKSINPTILLTRLAAIPNEMTLNSILLMI